MIKGVFIWRFRMDSEEMFIKAARKKMRFPYKGQATVEDLWDLPVTELDKIFKILNAEAKKAKEESLLETKSEESEKLAVRIGIIKYIVSVKLEEKKEAELAKERKEQKQRIMKVLASKQDEELKGKSVEELEKMLEELK
jgi:hypothetical protein